MWSIVLADVDIISMTNMKREEVKIFSSNILTNYATNIVSNVFVIKCCSWIFVKLPKSKSKKKRNYASYLLKNVNIYIFQNTLKINIHGSGIKI